MMTGREMGSAEPRTALVTSSCTPGAVQTGGNLHQDSQVVPDVPGPRAETVNSGAGPGTYRKTPKVPKKAYFLNDTFAQSGKVPNAPGTSQEADKTAAEDLQTPPGLAKPSQKRRVLVNGHPDSSPEMSTTYSPTMTQSDKITSNNDSSSDSLAAGAVPGPSPGTSHSLSPPQYDAQFQVKAENDLEDNNSRLSTNSGDITSTMTRDGYQRLPGDTSPPVVVKLEENRAVQGDGDPRRRILDTERGLGQYPRHPISSTGYQDDAVQAVIKTDYQYHKQSSGKGGGGRVVSQGGGPQRREAGNMRPPTQPPPSSNAMRPPPPPPPIQHHKGGKEKHHLGLHQQEEPSSSIPDLEFDGTTVLCRVCGDKASGFHYGVHSCEGCKGFFRRSIQQKIQYRPCTKNQQCSILRINRNRCQYCRLRKCIAVGMSRDAVRFGRVPKREKARILAAMHQSCQSRSAERAAVAEQLNNGSGASGGVSGVSGSSAASLESAPAAKQEEEEGKEGGEEGEEEEASRLANTVLRAHSDTCHFAHLRPKEGGCPRAGPVYSVQGRNGPILACPLNPRRPLVAGLAPDPTARGEDTVLQDFSQRFSPAIRGVVEFAKRIPGFALLSQSDQVTLLKAGVFEVLLLRLACLFDAQTNTMTCLNGELLRRESIISPSSSPSHSPSSPSSNARFLVDSMFEFAARLNSLQLSDAELALFSAVVIIAPDRPGLRHTDLISRIHSRLVSSLSLLLSRNHPSPPSLLHTLQSYIPDLRTLNTLHSEKLLAFKMTEQQNQSAEEHDDQYARAQGCPAHAMQAQTQDAWKDDDVQEVEEDEILEEEDRWRPNPRAPTLSTALSGVKSPLGSVSSSESVCSGEVASLSEFRTSTTAPLLAATLAGAPAPALGGFPKRRRHRDRSGSNSEEDTCGGPAQAPQTAPRTYFRKLDSPSDSGIESGTERLEKGSTSTSVCSSPRSSLEDKEEVVQRPPGRRCPHLDRPQAVEDMPVLKRVLQAPPLYDTNSLMDEAYKPHKKFRALRKDPEAEAPPQGPLEAPRGGRGQEKPPYATLEPVRMEVPPSTAPHAIISTLNMHFPQITIHPHPAPNRLSPQACPNPPLLLQKALLQPPANQRSLQSHQHQALLSALSGEAPRPASTSPLAPSPLPGPALGSSLSSTHTTLARSLMEGPKMTPEQMKRTDIIHSYIMREGVEDASGSCSRKPETVPEERRQMYRKEPPSQAPGVLVFNGSYVHMGWKGPQEHQYQPPKPEAKQPLNLSKKTPPPSPATTPVLEA